MFSLHNFVKIIFVSSLTVLVAACGSKSYSDLDAFMAEKKARPAGAIKPIPPFKAYKAFSYAAAGKRSPFERPIEIQEITRIQTKSSVEPDKNRVKEYLEQFSLDSLKMVGTLEQGGDLWALMQDKDGGVHRVKRGNYLGKNHGRIVETADSYLSVIEIVPNGTDGWVERPRTVKLKVVDTERL